MKYLFLLLTILIISCHPDKNKIVDRNKPVFKSNDASRLFFKNVRYLYYNIEEKNAGKIQVMKLKDRPEPDSTKAQIFVNIINNWHQDKAYPMLEFSQYFNDRTEVKLEIRNKNSIVETLIFDKEAPISSHFYFSAALYEAILKNHKIFLQPENSELLKKEIAREAFRISMVDFYRLVAIY